MAITVLKKTPIHCVIAISGAGATETIDLSTTLATERQTSVSSPKVNIQAIHWSVPSGNATITRNSVQLWAVTGAFSHDFTGFSDVRENGSNIVVVTPAGGGTVIIEVVKVSGYGDEQHPYV
jgi:late competence protein required for DNA uptake (superfamily II DNA/RNA helicase)